MAYNNGTQQTNNGKGNSFQGNKTTAPAAAAKGGASNSVPLFSTGLFKADKGPALATVRTKEDLVIPAGSYINLYENDKPGENAPLYRIQIRKVEPKE